LYSPTAAAGAAAATGAGAGGGIAGALAGLDGDDVGGMCSGLGVEGGGGAWYGRGVAVQVAFGKKQRLETGVSLHRLKSRVGKPGAFKLCADWILLPTAFNLYFPTEGWGPAARARARERGAGASARAAGACARAGWEVG
jgi:hypothetical protein